MTNFNNTLINYISEKNLTAKKFAEMVGIKESTFYDLLRSDNIMLSNALKIVDYLNSSLDYFEKKTKTFKCNYNKGYKVDLCKSVKEYLEKNNISYLQLCRDTGISKANYTRWRQGGMPKHQTIVTLANYFGVSIDKFIGRT